MSSVSPSDALPDHRRGGRAAPPGPARHAAGAEEVYAALDLGTNNCRLLVARGAGAGFRVIDAFSRIVRLGEGLAATGLLSEAAMQRTLEALKICAGKIDQRGVTRARYVATEACRRAGNCEAFLDRVQRTTGIAIETISTEEEARLAVAGCAPLLDRRKPYAIVFDIGGGSTELVWLRLSPETARPRPDILGSVSLPFGVVTFTERYGGDVIAPERYAAMVAEARSAMAPFAARHRVAEALAAGAVQMLGSSGTVTTLAGIQLNLPRYIRSVVDGSILTFAAAEAISARLAAMPCAARAVHPCIGRERADLVVAGCAILAAICALWPVGRLRVADRGVREGILFSLLAAAA
ncbi:MAG TPA: Ppx/GppA phosphatase family protein [Stellaceae bacterium]|nr:Ppx/GppA phosphatase family protein [Stellaceae bacterium]